MTKEQAAITLHQIGGGVNKLSTMIGAHTFLRDEQNNAVSFKFKAGNKANYCKITLTDMDLYDIVIGKIRGMNSTIIVSFDGLYAEDLQSVFEESTGLCLSFS